MPGKTAEKAEYKTFIDRISALKPKKCPARLMEVCGTHTMAISRSGMRSALPDWLGLLSGPGCPVCVTPGEEVDRIIAIAERKDVIVTTFGDMMRVPGSRGSLNDAKRLGADVRIVYSPVDALRIAEENPSKETVFMGVGFETTSPTVASTIIIAEKRGLKNFSVLPAFKLIPPALRAIASSGEVKVDGLMLPGHVSAILGSAAYGFLSSEFSIPSVITGFEAEDILKAISMLLGQISGNTSLVENQYTRVVTPEGNIQAKKVLDAVFDAADSRWRGLGVIPKSGYVLKKKFEVFDASHKFDIKVTESAEPDGCICGEVLRGVKSPADCVHFGMTCTPVHPVGPCMVSSEGSCAAHYMDHRSGDANG